MKNIFGKIFNFFKKIIYILIGIFFSKEQKTLEKKEQKTEDVYFQSKKEHIERKQEEEDSHSTETRNFWKEERRREKKYVLSEEEIGEYLEKIIEKIYKIKIENLSISEKERLTKYKKKVIKEKIKEPVTKENINKVLKEIVKKDQEVQRIKKQKEENSFVKEEKEQELERIPENLFTFTNSLQKPKLEDMKEAIRENRKTKTDEESFGLKNEVQKLKEVEVQIPKKMEEEEIIRGYKEKNIFIETEKDRKTGKNVQNFSVFSKPFQKIQVEPKKETQENRNRERKEMIIEENHDYEKNEKKILELKEKENQKEPKKETQKIIEFEKIEKERKFLEESSKKEFEKEDFFEKEYDRIERKVKEQMIFLENVLSKNLESQEKEKITIEIQKLDVLGKNIIYQKEKDLENVRISLEEGIREEEIGKMTEYLKEFKLKKEYEYAFLRKKFQNKSKEEQQILEKRIIKETLKDTLKSFTVPGLLLFPFLKNKYAKKAMSFLFLFSSFQFLKNLIFQNWYQEDEDLSFLKTGKDAFEESINLTHQNKEDFKNLKEMIYLKYPELKRDEEFQFLLNEIEKSLEKETKKLEKEEQAIQKYFKNTYNFARKRKRGI